MPRRSPGVCGRSAERPGWSPCDRPPHTDGPCAHEQILPGFTKPLADPPVRLHFERSPNLHTAPYIMHTMDMRSTFAPIIGDSVMFGAKLYRVMDRVIFYTPEMRVSEITLYLDPIPDLWTTGRSANDDD